MIFYIATDENGHRQLRGTQADAKAVNKQFEQLDIPTDKAGLMAFVQDLFTQIDAAKTEESPAVTATPAEPQEAELAVAPPPASPPPNPTMQKVRTADEIEEMWPNLPISFRFHLCSLTMEDARSVDWFGTSPPKAKQGYGGKLS